MAVETVKAVGITNRDATPPVLNTAGRGAPGRVVEVQDYVTVPASSSVASKFIMGSVPSNAVVSSIRIYSEAQTAGKVDVGAYRNTRDGGAVVDADFFASAVDLAAAVDGTDVTNESTTNTIDKRQQPLWQALGMTSDPKSDLDIVCTVVTTAVTTGAGKLALKIQYVH